MKTIQEYTLHTGSEEQVFHIPGWGGVAHVQGHDKFANQLSVFCHADDRKANYVARFVVTAPGGESPTNDYVYCATAVSAGYVWHVWRNAVTEKVVDK